MLVQVLKSFKARTLSTLTFPHHGLSDGFVRLALAVTPQLLGAERQQRVGREVPVKDLPSQVGVPRVLQVEADATILRLIFLGHSPILAIHSSLDRDAHQARFRQPICVLADLPEHQRESFA
eukprot:3152324-Pyramimonas_sp.AAC.2